MDSQIIFELNKLINLFEKMSESHRNNCDCLYCKNLMELKYIKKDFIESINVVLK